MYWEQLRNSSPEKISRKVGAVYQEYKYRLEVSGQIYSIDPRNEKVNGRKPDYFFEAFILQYLLMGNPVSPTGEWISEQEIPGGPLFFRGPHAIPVGRISKGYGDNPKKFIDRGKELGGKPDKISEFAINLKVLPLIPVCLILWPEDDEFAAESRMLFDTSTPKNLPKDSLWALSCWFIDKFVVI